MASQEGYVEVLGHNLFYRIFGEPRKGTILCLHGGPGATHDYLLPLADLARGGYRVVFYDQLGCGRSELPKDRGLLMVEHYTDEVEELRKTLRLGRIHLIGSSWGGQLAISYALKYQDSLMSLVTVGGYHNVLMMFEEMQRMKRELPPEIYRTLRRYEEMGDYENQEYLRGVTAFYRKHLCTLKEWPLEVQYSLDHTSKLVYETMNGPNEFTIIGNTRYWDASDRLGGIKVPTLILGGEYDEVSPAVARDMHRRIRGSKLVIFRRSSHMPFWEERKEFMKVVLTFISNAGAQAGNHSHIPSRSRRGKLKAEKATN